MKIQSLLLEMQHSKKWDSTQRNCLLRQKQGRDTHSERKSAGVPPSEGECCKEVFKSFIQVSSFRFYLPLANYLISFSTLDLRWGTPLDEQAPPSFLHPPAKEDLRVKACGKNKTHYSLPLTTWLLMQMKPSFICVMSPLSQKEEDGSPLILDSNKVLPLFVLALTISLTIAMTIILRCLQETNTGYLHCLCCYSHFPEQTGSCKCLNWSPPIHCLIKCQQF